MDLDYIDAAKLQEFHLVMDVSLHVGYVVESYEVVLAVLDNQVDAFLTDGRFQGAQYDADLIILEITAYIRHISEIFRVGWNILGHRRCEESIYVITESAVSVLDFVIEVDTVVVCAHKQYVHHVFPSAVDDHLRYDAVGQTYEDSVHYAAPEQQMTRECILHGSRKD